MRIVNEPKATYEVKDGAEIICRNPNGVIIEMLDFKSYGTSDRTIINEIMKEDAVTVYLCGKNCIDGKSAFVIPHINDKLVFHFTSGGQPTVELITDNGGGGELEGWQIDLMEQLRPLQEEGVLYYSLRAKDAPEMGDRRDVSIGMGRNSLEEFDGEKWVKKVEIGCVETDSITLRQGLTDIKVLDSNRDSETYRRNINIVRNLKSMNGIQVGSSFKPLVLTNNSPSPMVYWPDSKIKRLPIQADYSEHIDLPAFIDYTHQDSNCILDSFSFRTSNDMKLRVRFVVANNGESAVDVFERYIRQGGADDNLVYESLPETEYYNPESKFYGGLPLRTGAVDQRWFNEMYLTNGCRYIIIFDSLEYHGDLLGVGTTPAFGINFREEFASEVLTMKNIRNKDLTFDANYWIMFDINDDEGNNIANCNMIGSFPSGKAVSAKETPVKVGDEQVPLILQSLEQPKIKLPEKESADILDASNVGRYAVAKFDTKTKDFRQIGTISGTYRCFNMDKNLPDGYKPGDNDFYASLYYTDDNFIIIDAIDVRSGSRHQLCKISGEWGSWKSQGGGGGGWDPKVIGYSINADYKDNITCRVDRVIDTISVITPQIVFDNEVEQEKRVNIEFETEFNAEYAISYMLTKANTTGCGVVSVLVNGVEMGAEGSTNVVYLKDTKANNIEVVAKGKRFSKDGGDTWTTGYVYPLNLKIGLVNDVVDIPLLDVTGKLNKKLAPDVVMITDGYRIRIHDSQFCFEKFDAKTKEWVVVGTIG